MRDYVKIAKDYARAALRDKKRKKHGLFIQLAAKRFLDDLRRARLKRKPFVFDKWHAADPCDFIEKLPHVEGKWDSPTIVLHPSHIFFIVQLFGFRSTQVMEIEGWGRFRPRRYSSALFAVARKNAKSTLGAGILLYCDCCEPEEGAQLISAATTYDQASIIWGIAKKMVDKTPELRDHFGLQTWAKSITRYETGSSFKPVHAKASTQDGLNPSHISLDEIHAHKTPDLRNVLTSAAGARANPLFLYTTTEGYLNAGPWSEIRMFAIRLLKGVFGNTADHFLVVFFAVDDKNDALKIKADDEFDESAWIKANPLIDVNPILLKSIRQEAVEARQMPSKMAEFRIKRLNRQSSVADGLVDLDKWKECAGHVDLAWLADYPCWGGLDLASNSDLASFRLLWIVEGIKYTYGWRFVPEDAVKYRTERGTVPYQAWVESGQLIATPGNVTDYDVIEETILDVSERFHLQMIAYDSWNAMTLVNSLVAQEVPMIEFVQGPKSYHPSIQDLERAYMTGRLAHDGDEVLLWCASNVVPRRDVNMNIAPDKKRSPDKIDDFCSLLMANAIAIAADDEPDLSGFLSNPVIG